MGKFADKSKTEKLQFFKDWLSILSSISGLLAAPFAIWLYLSFGNLINERVASWCTLGLFFIWISLVITVPCIKKSLRKDKFRILYLVASIIVYLTIFVALWIPFNHIEVPSLGVSKAIFDENNLIGASWDEWKKAYDDNAIITLEAETTDYEFKYKASTVYMQKDVTNIGEASQGFSSVNPSCVHILGKNYLVWQTIKNYYRYFDTHKDIGVYFKTISNNSILISENNSEAIAISFDQHRPRILSLYWQRFIGAFENPFYPYKDWRFRYGSHNWHVWRFRLDPSYGSWKILEFHGGLKRERAIQWYTALKGNHKWHHVNGYPN